MEGHHRKVGLLPDRVIVELVDAPLEMGMITTVSSLVLSAIFFFRANFCLLVFSSNMSSFRKQLTPFPAAELGQGPLGHLFLL